MTEETTPESSPSLATGFFEPEFQRECCAAEDKALLARLILLQMRQSHEMMNALQAMTNLLAWPNTFASHYSDATSSAVDCSEDLVLKAEKLVAESAGPPVS